MNQHARVCRLIMVAGLLMGAVACGSAPLPPADRSTPEGVASAYLAAWTAGALDEKCGLVIPARRGQCLANGASDHDVTDIAFMPAIPFDRTGSDVPAEYDQVVQVPVTFYLDEFSGATGLPGGRTDWAYVVVFDQAAQQWAIAGEGLV